MKSELKETIKDELFKEDDTILEEKYGLSPYENEKVYLEDVGMKLMIDKEDDDIYLIEKLEDNTWHVVGSNNREEIEVLAGMGLMR